MNKRPFIILSAFLLLFSLIEKGQATETYRPETSVAGFIQLPGSGRQVYNFNPGWRFFRGDVRGAEAVNYRRPFLECRFHPSYRRVDAGRRKRMPQLSGSGLVS